MSQKLVKLIRQFAKYRGIPYRVAKKVWDRSPREEQIRLIPELKRAIEVGKDAEKKEGECENCGNLFPSKFIATTSVADPHCPKCGSPIFKEEKEE